MHIYDSDSAVIKIMQHMPKYWCGTATRHASVVYISTLEVIVWSRPCFRQFSSTFKAPLLSDFVEIVTSTAVEFSPTGQSD